MLAESYYNIGYYTLFTECLLESMDFDNYSEQTRSLKEKYRDKLLKKFKNDPMKRSIIMSPYFFRYMAYACSMGVDSGIFICKILDIMTGSNTPIPLATTIFAELMGALLIMTNEDGSLKTTKQVMDSLKKIIDKINKIEPKL